MDVAVTIVVFVAVFALIYVGAVERRVAVLAGAGTILVYGLLSGFFSVKMAVDAIYFETLALIFGMSAVSAMLARSGLFLLIANRTATKAGGNGWWLLLLFALITYGFSLLVNNLAAMVIIVPVTLTICRQMEISPVPILIAEIIASNLGGASTMIGDFPNMIISSAGHVHFFDFIAGMMVPCLVLLAVMLGFFQWRRAECGPGMADGATLKRTMKIDPAPPTDPRLMRAGLIIMAFALIGFMASDASGIRPGWVALVAGVVALALVGDEEGRDWFDACGGRDILFFAGLFVMVGGLVAAGSLDGVLWLINLLGGGSDVPMMLALMWVAALSTIFLNAGPATAFFVPIASGMHATMADPTVWWALSLGVLAGSSAALTGATAGPVVVSHLERFVADHPQMKSVIAAGPQLDFQGYLRWGMPVMALFLGVSSLYIVIVAQ